MDSAEEVNRSFPTTLIRVTALFFPLVNEGFPPTVESIEEGPIQRDSRRSTTGIEPRDLLTTQIYLNEAST